MQTEFWDIYDNTGNLTGAIKSRNSALLCGEFHLVASVWVINPRGEILIQKRSATKPVHPGMWSITGGAAHAGESSERACVRETAEEIGLRLDVSDLELLYRHFGADTIFDDYITVRGLPPDRFVLQPDEVCEIKWVGADEVKKLFNDGLFVFDKFTLFDRVTDYIGSLNVTA